MAAVEWDIDHRRMLCQFGTAFEQAGDQEIAVVAPAQHHSRPECRRDDVYSVAKVLRFDRDCFPWRHFWLIRDLIRHPVLDEVRVFGRASAREPGFRTSGASSARNKIAHA